MTLTLNGGTLSGVTYDGTLDLSESGASVNLASGTVVKNAAGTGPGTINVTGEYADLDFDNTQTFNNATINLGNTIGYTDTLYAYDTAGAGGQVLTLASGVTVDVVGYAAITSSSSSGDGIVNKGVINDTTSPNVGSPTIEGNAFTNQGSINVENGQNLTVDSTTFANTGTITVDGTSAVTFESALTTAQLGTVPLRRPGRRSTLLGRSTISRRLSMSAPFFSLDGAIDGGTINGAVNLTASGQSLAFLGGVPTVKNAAGTGPGTINVTGEYADLYFDNTQTFNNATINLGNTIGYTDTLYAYDTAGAGGQVLTLASGVTVDVVGYAAITSSSSSGDGIVNKGVINDTTSPNVGQSDDRRQRLHQPGLDQCRERPEPHGGQHDLRQHRNHHRRRNERRHVRERLDHGATGNGPRGVRGDARLCWTLNNIKATFQSPSFSLYGAIDGGTINGAVNLTASGQSLAFLWVRR